MKRKDIQFTIGDLPLTNPVQEKLTVLYNNSFLDHEIAALTGLRKKMIKQITNGKYLPIGKERDRFCKIFDELIIRLNITEATFYNGDCPEADVDTTDYIKHNIINHKILVYKSPEDNRIAFKDNKDIYNLTKPSATMHIATNNKKMILIIRADISLYSTE